MKILIALVAAGVASVAVVAVVIATSSSSDIAGTGPNQQVLVGMPVAAGSAEPHCSSCVTTPAATPKTVSDSDANAASTDAVPADAQPQALVPSEPSVSALELKMVADLKANAAESLQTNPLPEGAAMDCCASDADKAAPATTTTATTTAASDAATPDTH